MDKIFTIRAESYFDLYTRFDNFVLHQHFKIKRQKEELKKRVANKYIIFIILKDFQWNFSFVLRLILI